VLNTYKSNDTYYYQIKTDRVNEEKEKLKIMLKSDRNLKIEPDYRIDSKIKAYQNSSKSDISKGYFLVSYIDKEDKIKAQKINKSIGFYIYGLKVKIKEAFSDLYNEDISAFLNSVILGDKYSLSSEVKDSFRAAGVSHMTVVSGMHLSIYVGIISLFFRKMKRKNIGYFCEIGFVCFYMALTRMSVSVIRSGVMFIIYIFSKILMREKDSITSLGCASFVVLFNPYIAGDIGLLLSFSATSGIILLKPHIDSFVFSKVTFKNNIIKRLYRYAFSLISLTLSAVIFTFPLTVIFFKYSSTLQIIYGLFVCPMLGVVLFCSVFAVIFYYLPFCMVLCYPFAFIGGVCSKYILFAVSLTKYIPFATVGTDKMYVYIFLGVTFILMGIWLFINKKRKYAPFLVCLVCIVFLASFLTNYFVSQNKSYLTVYESGYGVTATINHQGKKGILSCGGTLRHKDEVIEKIKYSDGDNLFLSVTSEENDRSYYADEILDLFDFEKVLLYDKNAFIVDFENKDQEIEDNFVLRFENIRIEYIKGKGDKYNILISSGKKKILILEKFTDCKTLPKRCLDAETVITDGKCYNEYLINTEQLIICSEEKMGKKLNENIEINRKKVAYSYMGDYKIGLEV
ncbi:MAG: ComEC/Rec2 family competence protein, partial [Acutalibacteraceae bacterium]